MLFDEEKREKLEIRWQCLKIQDWGRAVDEGCHVDPPQRFL